MPEIFDSESEFALLGGLLKHAINGLVAIEGYGLTPGDFASEDTQRVYYLAKSYLEKTSSATIDPAILRLEAKALNVELDQDLLDALYNSATPLKDLPQYAKVIKVCSIGRKLISRTTAFLNESKNISAASKYSDICKGHDQFIRDTTDILANSNTQDFVHLYDGIGEFLNNIISGKEHVGLVCNNFPKWMTAIGGSLRFSSLNVISGSAKDGKSALCLAIARDIAEQCVPVLYIDTELVTNYQACRLLAQKTGVPLKRVEYGSFINDPEDEKKIKQEISIDKNKFAIYHYPAAGFLLEDILIVIKRWITSKVGRKNDGKAKPCLIIMDYLKCSSEREFTAHMQEYQILGLVVTKLHDIATQFNVPVVMAAQLNRTGGIGASARIDHLCSNRTIVTRKLPEELLITGKYGNRKLSVPISRFREPHSPNDYLSINMDMSNGKWSEGPWNSEIMKDFVLENNQKKIYKDKYKAEEL
jgi:replicative DNA helicase